MPGFLSGPHRRGWSADADIFPRGLDRFRWRWLSRSLRPRALGNQGEGATGQQKQARRISSQPKSPAKREKKRTQDSWTGRAQKNLRRKTHATPSACTAEVLNCAKIILCAHKTPRQHRLERIRCRCCENRGQSSGSPPRPSPGEYWRLISNQDNLAVSEQRIDHIALIYGAFRLSPQGNSHSGACRREGIKRIRRAPLAAQPRGSPSLCADFDVTLAVF